MAWCRWSWWTKRGPTPGSVILHNHNHQSFQVCIRCYNIWANQIEVILHQVQPGSNPTKSWYQRLVFIKTSIIYFTPDILWGIPPCKYEFTFHFKDFYENLDAYKVIIKIEKIIVNGLFYSAHINFTFMVSTITDFQL